MNIPLQCVKYSTNFFEILEKVTFGSIVNFKSNLQKYSSAFETNSKSTILKRICNIYNSPRAFLKFGKNACGWEIIYLQCF